MQSVRASTVATALIVGGECAILIILMTVLVIISVYSRNRPSNLSRILRQPVQQQDILAESAQDEVTGQLEIVNDVYETAIPQNKDFQMKQNVVYETISSSEEYDDGNYVIIKQ